MTASQNTPGLTRRRVVRGAAAVAAATAVPLALTTTAADAATGAAAAEGRALDFVPADPLLHLLRRATWGPTPASVTEIRRLGAAAWLNRQLAAGTIPDKVCDSVLTRLPLTRLSVGGVRAKVKAGAVKMYGWDTLLQVGYAAIARATWSNRQLFEVMVDFWSNHLNVTCPSGDVWDSRQDYDRTVIRAHALGRFSDMLKASARHPAMLTYLDNRFSSKAAPNENYGRELLELHTVGLVYSETDVKNAARLLTGRTVSWQTGTYRYDQKAHATGPVTVLGFRHANKTPAGGEAASTALLDYLATHPATAKRIATKLCIRFVSDEPPATLVAALAKVYLANRSAIAPVLRALFTSAEFAASAGAKTRTPLEDVVATVRILGYGPETTGIKGVQALYWMAQEAGQAPLAWAPPNGYPDVATAWASPSGHLMRWNMHLNVAAGWWPNTLVRPANLMTGLIGTLPSTYGGLIDAVAVRLFGRTLNTEHTAALTAFYDKSPASALKPSDAAAGWASPYLVALMLNSPYFAVR
ncbi:DUF1800 domain-containing protein [Actinoplanes auranticolor]|uniref:DUF1800 domain-containing protein n=1 Tax=Actinoplanes auranticolor TaxID=47988 RepID=A0A919SM52_9ACTN|nr:DUF1800 domain-containing protein [Actinoplanes auranticolor]GIM75345.1 hypothetical protein Aau02nite_65480 [Actinoplanes auranticolor]